MARLLAISLALCVMSLSLWASAQQKRVIEGARILLSDIVPGAPTRLSSLDLGPAPPPGGSRVVSVEDVHRRLRQVNEPVDAIRFKAPVRVISAHRMIDPEQWSTLVEPAVQAALPKGVALIRVSPTIHIKTTPRATIGKASISTLPRRVGQTRATAMVELMDGDLVLSRVPVPITLRISAEAARPDVARGTSVRLFIESGSVVVSTRGEVLKDANVGEIVRVRVASTRRVVRAELLSGRKAKVSP